MDVYYVMDGPAEGHQLAVVACRGGRLYCMCTMPLDGPTEGHQLAVVACRGGQPYCMCTMS